MQKNILYGITRREKKKKLFGSIGDAINNDDDDIPFWLKSVSLLKIRRTKQLVSLQNLYNLQTAHS